MVANPLWGPGVKLEGGEQACADRCQDGARKHERVVVANLRNEAARDNGSNNDRKQDRDVPDARLVRVDSFHGLEPDWQVIDGHEENGTHEERESGRGPDAAFAEHEWADRCDFGLPELDTDEGQEA